MRIVVVTGSVVLLMKRVLMMPSRIFLAIQAMLIEAMTVFLASNPVLIGSQKIVSFIEAILCVAEPLVSATRQVSPWPGALSSPRTPVSLRPDKGVRRRENCRRCADD